MTKEDFRKYYLQKRKELSEAEYRLRNEKLYTIFFAHIELSFIKVFHTFLPAPGKREPDTWPIVDRISREFSHIKISIPRVNNQTRQLDHFYFEGLQQLKNNRWGIPEPEQGHSTPLEKIDMVLVPLLAFDTQGHRIGYGKGYYDKFLRLCRPGAIKIGVSHFTPEEKIPCTPADIKLDLCVTPQTVFVFHGA
jgi:5-formyltetrahydrofolate cyclo-ligase